MQCPKCSETMYITKIGCCGNERYVWLCDKPLHERLEIPLSNSSRLVRAFEEKREKEFVDI